MRGTTVTYLQVLLAVGRFEAIVGVLFSSRRAQQHCAVLNDDDNCASNSQKKAIGCCFFVLYRRFLEKWLRVANTKGSRGWSTTSPRRIIPRTILRLLSHGHQIYFTFWSYAQRQSPDAPNRRKLASKTHHTPRTNAVTRYPVPDGCPVRFADGARCQCDRENLPRTGPVNPRCPDRNTGEWGAVSKSLRDLMALLVG
ncbi:hypothetical protein F4802DRAFT_376827 [Xylaria palmicola]|nr:hypothetical protein F4802DRAFT_376827 [Xylaria palmicola]